MNTLQHQQQLASWPALRVDVVEAGSSAKSGWRECQIGRHITFSTERLEGYCFAKWEPIVFDLLLLAATVEYCDKICRRSTVRWGRDITCIIPVHDPAHWSSTPVANALLDALEFLTGDRWSVQFKQRIQPAEPARQGSLSLANDVQAVIPYSNGLDSRAVAGLLERNLGDGLVRVRLGTKKSTDPDARRMPFAAVPYAVKPDQNNLEGSGRSRGFKFTLIAGIAAYLSGAQYVVMPESAQGALGPVLVPVGQAYEDYRNHPSFTAKMTAFLDALLGRRIPYEYPRLWHTKGETIRAYLETNGEAPWVDTRSCWQQSRQVSVLHRRRQCGVCAACQLRCLSVHAAGLTEEADIYVWENLQASQFELGASADFDPKLMTKALKEYAIAGVLHLDHLAALGKSEANRETVSHGVFQLATSLGLSEDVVSPKLTRALQQHNKEWRGYLDSLGQQSFIASWVARS